MIGRLSSRLVIAAFLFQGATLDHLLSRYGLLAVALFVMVESLGVPFPGETMLIAAALYAGTTHHLVISEVIAAGAAGAIVGDNIGFGIGRWGGFRLLRRYGKYVRMDEAKLKLGRYVFMKHGAKVVFFGRFVSVLRTYAAFLAGTNRMTWSRFLAFNAAGGIVWALIYGLGYYYAGSALKQVGTGVDIALGIAGALVVVAFLIFLRRNAKRLEAEAERALPGSMDDIERDAADSAGGSRGNGGAAAKRSSEGAGGRSSEGAGERSSEGAGER